MANKRKKRNPRNSNVKKRNQQKPVIIIQERSKHHGEWIILANEILKFLNSHWTECKDQIVQFFSQL